MPTRLVYAHRGASLELPENTLEAFRLAVSFGIRAIETDAHMTADGRVVLSHDATGGRTAGVPQAIRDCTLGQVRTWNMGREREESMDVQYVIPTLDEALAEFPNVVFNVDAKQTYPDMIPALIKCIRQAQAEDRVRIASFHWVNLQRARSLGYKGETGLSPVEVAQVALLPAAIVRAVGVGGNAAQVPMRAWGMQFASERAIARLHGFGLRVDFWTINDTETARMLFAMGADGVMTDDPRALAKAAELG